MNQNTLLNFGNFGHSYYYKTRLLDREYSGLFPCTAKPPTIPPAVPTMLTSQICHFDPFRKDPKYAGFN